MNILFVNTYAGPSGGVEYYINALSRKLIECGHKTGIVHWDDYRGRKNFLHYYYLPEIWDKELEFSKDTAGKIDNLMSSFLPDVVYLHNMENGKAISYINGKYNTVRYVHGYKTVDPDGKMLLKHPLEVNTYPLGLSCFLRAFTRRSMPRHIIKGIKAYSRAKGTLEATKNLKKVIVASNHMEDVLIQNGVEKNRINVLPYFIDYGGSIQSDCFDRYRMLFSGRIAEGKGLEILLDTLELVKEDFVLDIAGEGPLEELCKEKAKNSGLSKKVVFNGWEAHNNLANYYKKCLFQVVPSVWPEPFGICGIEAAFFGKPTIAFKVGGIEEWLDDGKTGYLIEPYNKEKMAEKIQFLLNNPDEACQMGLKARRSVIKKYMPDLHIERLMDIFK